MTHAERLLAEAYRNLIRQTEAFVAAGRAAEMEDTAAVNHHLRQAANEAFLCSKNLFACTTGQYSAAKPPPKGSKLH